MANGLLGNPNTLDYSMVQARNGSGTINARPDDWGWQSSPTPSPTAPTPRAPTATTVTAPAPTTTTPAPTTTTPTPATTPAPQGGPVPGWGYFSQAQSIDYDPTNTEFGRDFLAGVQKYDPNARFEQYEAGGGEGGPGQMKWRFTGDQTKMPWYGKNVIDTNDGAYRAQYYSPMSNAGGDMDYFKKQVSGNFDTSQLYNPNAMHDDPTLGRVTDARNLKPQQQTWLDIVGPMLVGGFGSFLGGGGALISLLQKAPQLLNSWSHGGFDPFSVASMALPYIPGVGNNPLLRQGLNFAIGQARRRGG